MGLPATLTAEKEFVTLGEDPTTSDIFFSFCFVLFSLLSNSCMASTSAMIYEIQFP